MPLWTDRNTRPRWSTGTRRVPVHGVRRERREAYRDIFGAAGFGRTVADPLAGRRDDGLAGADVQGAALVFDPQCAPEHHRDLFEVRPLARLDPTLRADHAGNADA